MSRQLDKWQIDGIKRGVKEGKSQREIARIVGCKLATVNVHCQKIRKETQGKAETTPSCPAIVEQRRIDLMSEPTTESIKTDILTVYRHSLYELNKRLPSMTDDQVFMLSMQLLNQLNNGNTEN